MIVTSFDKWTFSVSPKWPIEPTRARMQGSVEWLKQRSSSKIGVKWRWNRRVIWNEISERSTKRVKKLDRVKVNDVKLLISNKHGVLTSLKMNHCLFHGLVYCSRKHLGAGSHQICRNFRSGFKRFKFWTSKSLWQPSMWPWHWENLLNPFQYLLI